jgi:hypothetical protein
MGHFICGGLEKKRAAAMTKGIEHCSPPAAQTTFFPAHFAPIK